MDVFSGIARYIDMMEHGAPAPVTTHLYTNLKRLLSGNASNKLAPVQRLIKQRNPQKLLDIGCGYGSIAIYYALNGIESVGIDLDKTGIESASGFSSDNSISNVHFEVMNACNISIAGFDVAVSTDFYEHLPYNMQIEHLRSVHNSLNEKGCYIIRAPHQNNIRQHVDGHIGLPSYALIDDQASKAGFKAFFTIAHTGYISPVKYHATVEKFILTQSWNAHSTYKALQKFGLANVIVCLQKLS